MGQERRALHGEHRKRRHAGIGHEVLDVFPAPLVRQTRTGRPQRRYKVLSLADAYVNAAMILSGMGPLGELKTTAGKLFAGSYAIFSGLVIVIATGFVLAFTSRPARKIIEPGLSLSDQPPQWATRGG